MGNLWQPRAAIKGGFFGGGVAREGNGEKRAGLDHLHKRPGLLSFSQESRESFFLKKNLYEDYTRI